MYFQVACRNAANRHGVGVYHYFRDAPVIVPSAIVAPTALEPYFASPLSVAWRLQAAVYPWVCISNLTGRGKS